MIGAGSSSSTSSLDSDDDDDDACRLLTFAFIVDGGNFGAFSVIGGGRRLTGGAALVGWGMGDGCTGAGAARDHSSGSSVDDSWETGGGRGRGLVGGSEGPCVLVAGDTGGVLPPTCKDL